MKSFGPKSEEWLSQIGIHSAEELEAYGPEKAFVDLKKINPHITKNMLWGMLGVLLDIHWSKLPAELKEISLKKVAELEDS